MNEQEIPNGIEDKSLTAKKLTKEKHTDSVYLSKDERIKAEKEEEETVSQQIFARDVRELEKSLVLGSRIYQLLQKRAEVWQLQEELSMARSITIELFCRLHHVGFVSVFEKYNQILKVFGTTQEEVLGQCKK